MDKLSFFNTLNEPRFSFVDTLKLTLSKKTNYLVNEALALIAEMKKHGVEPNVVTTLLVLSACSHGGLIEEGLGFFNSMIKDHRVELRLEHYSYMVDMLGRVGQLDSAIDLIKKV